MKISEGSMKTIPQWQCAGMEQALSFSTSIGVFDGFVIELHVHAVWILSSKLIFLLCKLDKLYQRTKNANDHNKYFSYRSS